MKTTIFTSNSLRHFNLINKVSEISSQCNAIVETKTIYPGNVKDFFKKSVNVEKYFQKVRNAEISYFEKNYFLKKNVNVKILKHGDLNYIKKKDIKFALNSDIYIVFGSSFIKQNWLINFLIKKKAINIHMGLSPFYRGSSCNFWAVKDKKPELVGSTIHYLSKGLDSGKIISHCLPDYKQKNCFNYTMSAVKSSHDCLKFLIKNKKLFQIKPIKQDKKYQIRYSKNKEFNDVVVKKFLKSNKKINIKNKIKINLSSYLVNPYYFNERK